MERTVYSPDGVLVWREVWVTDWIEDGAGRVQVLDRWEEVPDSTRINVKAPFADKANEAV